MRWIGVTIKYGFVVLLFIVIASRIEAQEKFLRKADFSINFRWDQSVLDFNYMGTNRILGELDELINRRGWAAIDSIAVVSYSSPEGTYRYNSNLSHRRAAAMNNYFIKRYPFLKNKVAVSPDGESWHLFRLKVEQDTSLLDSLRQKVLAIIDSKSDPDVKKSQLKQFDRGSLYRYFIQTYFVDLRRSFIRIMWQEDGAVKLMPLTDIQPITASLPSAWQPMPLTPVSPIALGEDKLLIALKTNLLYDLITALNVEIEIPIGQKFSIAVEDVFPWWNWGPHGRKYCFQMWEMGVEPRWGFRRTDERTALTGHFAGVYGMSAKYDLQWNTKWCYQGEYWSAGFTYGFAKKISRRFNMEFAASVGYLSTAYRHYVPDNSYAHLWRDRYKTGRADYIGLTKLKVSLVLPVLANRRRKEK